jgi:deoxyribodipyrimidine photo-lyase
MLFMSGRVGLALEVAATVGTSIIWFRRDLRLADHPALLAALAHGTTTPLFVLDPLFVKRSGAARFAFLLRNIRALDASMNRAIVVRHGDPLDIVPRFAQEVGADKVFISADFAPYGAQRDAEVASRLAAMKVELVAVGSPYAVNPGTVRKDDGKPYAVFTPFSRGWVRHGWSAPLPAPTSMNLRGAPDIKCDGIPADPELAAELPVAGEPAAWDRWEHFAGDALSRYKEERNNPDRDGSSKLSACCIRASCSPSCAPTPITMCIAANLVGASFMPTCCIINQAPHGKICNPRWSRCPLTPTIAPSSVLRHGAPGKRVIRSWMPACARCWPRVGCTTACA